MTEELLVEKEAGILTVTLNRPEARNALTAVLMQALASQVAAAGADPSVRVIRLRGAGEKAFCSGADLGGIDEEQQGIIRVREHLGHFAGLLQALARSPKPVVAQVHGYALAGGCGLAAAADVTIASEDAVFGIPELGVGLWGMMITAPIARAVGSKRALELFLSARRIGAAEAERIGLVNRVVPRSQLDEAVHRFCAELAERSPWAVTLGRESFYRAQEMGYSAAVDYLREMATILSVTEDAREGIRAFLQKRTPHWQGR